jgi:hypothetical protein
MSSFNVPVAVNVITFPSSGFITAFTITPDFSNLPAGFLTKVDDMGHFKAKFQSDPHSGKVGGPLSPGDQMNFVFTANAGFTVTDVGIAHPANLLTWTTQGATATAIVTGVPVATGTGHTKYSLTIKQNSSNSTRDIDPDFETELT